MDELRRADRRRRDAMISADVAALDALLADELVWTHSSGRKDDKAAFLEKIAAGSADYRSLEVSDDTVSSHGAIAIHHGTLTGRVAVDGREKELRNRFLSVWARTGETLRLLAWQSTGF
ncbi:MAG: nuclear transport factor 2 family protein [Pseudomonadota bacterium]